MKTAAVVLLACMALTVPAMADDDGPDSITLPTASLPPAPPEAGEPLKVVIPNLHAIRQESRPRKELATGGDASRQTNQGNPQPSFVPGSAPSSLFEKFYSDLFPGKALPSLPEVLRASLQPTRGAPQEAVIVPPKIIKRYAQHPLHRHFALAHHLRVKPHAAPVRVAAAQPTPKTASIKPAPKPAVVASAPAPEPLPWLITKVEPMSPEPAPKEPPLEKVAANSMHHAKPNWLSPLFIRHGGKDQPVDDADKPNFAENAPTAALPVDPFNREHLPEIAVAHNDQTPAADNVILASATTADGKPPGIARSLYSPGAIIKKEVLHMAKTQPDLAQAEPERLAALMPAAGDAPQPLIPLPPSSPAGPAQAGEPLPPPPMPMLPAPQAPAAIPPTGAPPPAAAPSQAPVSALPPTQVPAIAVTSPKICTPGEKTCGDQRTQAVIAPPAKTAEPKITLPSISPEKAKRSETKKPETAHAKHAGSGKSSAHHHHHHHHHAKAAAKSTRTHAKKATPTKKPVVIRKKKAEAPVLHIPASLGQAKKTGTPFSIERAQQMNDLFKPDDDGASIQRKDMDIAVEVKQPTMNANYELQKAYDAVTTGNPNAAMDIYKNVLQTDPNNTNALFGLATLYHRAGDLTQARALYSKLLSIDPSNRDGWNNYLALTADENPKDAVAHLEFLQAKNPDFSPIPAQLAIIYEKMGSPDKAVASMTHAITLAPDNLTYRYDLAIMFDKQGKYPEAAALYRQIVEAYQRGDKVPGDIDKIQQRLTFISSNRP